MKDPWLGDTADLGAFAAACSSYTEIRIQRNVARTVGLLNGAVMVNSGTVKQGVSARVWHDGSWGFASDASPQGLARVVEAATHNAAWLSARAGRPRNGLANPLAPPIRNSSDPTS